MPSYRTRAAAENREPGHHGSVDRNRLRDRLVPPPAAAELAETFKVLGDVTRVRIIDALSQDELCVCEIASLLELTESAVSHQLRLLRSLRLVRARREGRLVFYALDDEHILGLFHQALGHVHEEVSPPALAGDRG